MKTVADDADEENVAIMDPLTGTNQRRSMFGVLQEPIKAGDGSVPL